MNYGALALGSPFVMLPGFRYIHSGEFFATQARFWGTYKSRIRPTIMNNVKKTNLSDAQSHDLQIAHILQKHIVRLFLRRFNILCISSIAPDFQSCKSCGRRRGGGGS